MAEIYYKTPKTSETGKKVAELIAKGAEIRKQIEAFIKEIGAKDQYLKNQRMLFGTGICAVQFDETPDFVLWKKFRSYNGPETFYEPRLNAKEGRALAARFSSFGEVERSDLDNCVGWDSFLQNIGFDNNDTHFYFALDPDWKHPMPKDCVEITTSEYLNVK